MDALARVNRRPWPMRSSAAAKSRPGWWAQDEREAGLRAILNFGHTFGHAIEAGSGLRRMAAWRGGRLRHGDGGAAVCGVWAWWTRPSCSA